MSRVTQNQSSLYWLTSWPLASNPFSLSRSLLLDCFRRGTFRARVCSVCVFRVCVTCCSSSLKISYSRKVTNVQSAANRSAEGTLRCENRVLWQIRARCRVMQLHSRQREYMYYDGRRFDRPAKSAGRSSTRRYGRYVS